SAWRRKAKECHTRGIRSRRPGCSRQQQAGGSEQGVRRSRRQSATRRLEVAGHAGKTPTCGHLGRGMATISEERGRVPTDAAETQPATEEWPRPVARDLVAIAERRAAPGQESAGRQRFFSHRPTAGPAGAARGAASLPLHAEKAVIRTTM